MQVDYKEKLFSCHLLEYILEVLERWSFYIKFILICYNHVARKSRVIKAQTLFGVVQVADVQLNLNISLCGTSKQLQNVTIAKSSPFLKLSPKRFHTSSTSGMVFVFLTNLENYMLYY